MIYSVKLAYKEPIEGKEGMKKKKQNFLVFAHSCVEAECRMTSWIPANYQDAVVEEVKQTPYEAVRRTDSCETFWVVKFMSEQTEGKPKPYFIVSNATTVEEVVRKERSSLDEIEEVKKFKGIIDEDLISEEVKKSS